MSLSGHIDRVTSGGVVQGWARRAGCARPLTLEVMLEGEPVARAVADLFRADLLEAGLAHGHYAFSAALTRPIDPGEAALELVEAETGEVILAPFPIRIPRIVPPQRLSVEDLLSQSAGWTDEDVLGAVEILNLEGNLRRLGANRFVDAVFQFALGRGADSTAIAGYAPALLGSKITPDQMLKDILSSPERRGAGSALPSPYDNRYPFSQASDQAG